MLTLARGLRVIESFEGHHEGRSILEIAQSTGLSRAAIRRILFTLELLGYVERSRQVHRLKTQILRFGFSFLSSSSVVEAARPVLERISEQLHESSSMSMLDGGEIVYVARSAASRILAAGLSVGSRLPAYCTSMGRVLLASLPDRDLEAYLDHLKPKPLRPRPSLAFPSSRRPFCKCARMDTPSWMRNWSLGCDPLRCLFSRAAMSWSRPSMSVPICRAWTTVLSSNAVCPRFRTARAPFTMS